MKTRKTRHFKKRKNTRRFRQYGGTTLSCIRDGHPKMVSIEEDELKIIAPDHWICYGDTITSCITFTVVMENNWKIGAHIQPATELFGGNPQKYTPFNLLTKIQEILASDPNFSGAIKYIYIFGDSQELILSKTNSNTYKRLNNVNSIGFVEAGRPRNSLLLNSADSARIRTALNSTFHNKITQASVIQINSRITVQSGRRHHFFVLENGAIDIQANGLAYTRTI